MPSKSPRRHGAAQGTERFSAPRHAVLPFPFTAVNDEQQDALLLAAIWRITTAEQVRQYREDDTNSLYPEDEEYRMMIPIEEIEASFTGICMDPMPCLIITTSKRRARASPSSTIPIMRVIMCPLQRSRPIMSRFWDTLKRRKDTVTVRVAYVSNKDVAMDDYGNEIPPPPDQATYTQILHRRENGGRLGTDLDCTGNLRGYNARNPLQRLSAVLERVSLLVKFRCPIARPSPAGSDALSKPD